jgi:hypothetical protein
MRRKAAEDLLVNALAESHAKALRAYTHNVQWTTVGESAVLGKNLLTHAPTRDTLRSPVR